MDTSPSETLSPVPVSLHRVRIRRLIDNQQVARLLPVAGRQVGVALHHR